MPDYARFCGYCGADMIEEQNAPEQQPPEPVPAKDTAAQMSPLQASSRTVDSRRKQQKKPGHSRCISAPGTAGDTKHDDRCD